MSEQNFECDCCGKSLSECENQRQLEGKIMKEAINPKRRAEKVEMQQLGIKTKKAYRKWQKRERHKLREKEAKNVNISKNI